MHKGDRKAHPPTKPRKGFCVLISGSPAHPVCKNRRAGFARAWEGAREHTRAGASAFAFAPRAFPLGRPGRRMSAAELLKNEIQKRKRHDKRSLENEKRGCAMGGRRRPVHARHRSYTTTAIRYSRGSSKQLRGGARAGERIPSSPQLEALPEPPRPQERAARNSSAPRHLGASSPSENARGGCRG